MITGIARIFQQGAKRGSEATEWGNGGGIFCTLIFLFSLSGQSMGGGGGADDSGVARIC